MITIDSICTVEILCKSKEGRSAPAEGVHDQKVAQNACDAHEQDDHPDGVVRVVRDVHRWKQVAWSHGALATNTPTTTTTTTTKESGIMMIQLQIKQALEIKSIKRNKIPQSETWELLKKYKHIN